MPTMTLALLKAEIQTDPKALGYAAALANGDPSAVAQLLNSTYATVAKTYKANVRARDLMAAIVWSEVSAFTAAQWSALTAMFTASQTGVDSTQVTVRNFFAGLFAGKTATLAAMDAAAAILNPTRAQELWGENTQVTWNNVQDALALPS